jgi:hypothetical protein
MSKLNPVITDQLVADAFLTDLEILQADEMASYDIDAIYVNQKQNKIIVEIKYVIGEEGLPLFSFIDFEKSDYNELNIDNYEDTTSLFCGRYSE